MKMEELDDIFDEELEVENNNDGIIIDENDGISTNDDLFDDYNEDPKEKNTKLSALDKFLENKGIKNSLIVMVDDDNTEKEVDFYSLSEDEQIEVLNSLSAAEELDTDKKEFIDYLTENKLSVQDYLEKYKDTILEEQSAKAVPTYEIDNYDDQELFLLDLKTKYDLTDEELVSELEKELTNETLFKKKVDALRSEYKKLEDEYKTTELNKTLKDKEDKYNQFSDTMVDVATKTVDFYGIELEDTDKEEVLSYLLDLDDKGTSKFYKDLNTPEKLYEAAWFLKFGKSAFEALTNAYEEEINKLKKDKKVVIKDNKRTNSIYDI